MSYFNCVKMSEVYDLKNFGFYKDLLQREREIFTTLTNGESLISYTRELLYRNEDFYFVDHLLAQNINKKNVKKLFCKVLRCMTDYMFLFSWSKDISFDYSNSFFERFKKDKDGYVDYSLDAYFDLCFRTYWQVFSCINRNNYYLYRGYLVHCALLQMISYFHFFYYPSTDESDCLLDVDTNILAKEFNSYYDFDGTDRIWQLCLKNWRAELLPDTDYKMVKPSLDKIKKYYYEHLGSSAFERTGKLTFIGQISAIPCLYVSHDERLWQSYSSYELGKSDTGLDIIVLPLPILNEHIKDVQLILNDDDNLSISTFYK